MTTANLGDLDIYYETQGSTPVGTARRLAEATPGAELFLIANTKHMTFWDGSGAQMALEDFLLRHPVDSRR